MRWDSPALARAQPRLDNLCSNQQIGVGIDPDITQAVNAASGVWDVRTGQLVADQLARWVRQLRPRARLLEPNFAPSQAPTGPCSSQAATQPTASEPGPSTPPPAQRSKRTKAEPAAESNKGKAQGKAAKAKPAPQPGRWLDRDCNAALNMQRIGESRWRPLDLCWWPEQGVLPAKGKEYPGLGYKRLRDKPPKTQPAQAQ
ncbi:hypothetical protein QJQ45_008284 [Haematococcus lacustris]|nr:hypothetical protein QJQ45_008284 [Haematococcus lacustris]